ncbi:Protein sidekick-2, partial [Geodia barretti]
MGSGNTETITVDGATVMEATIPSLNPSTAYTVQVAAVNSVDTGVFSDRQSAMTLVAVPVLMSDSTTATSISLSWTSAGSEGVSYEVNWQRNTSVGCTDEDTGSTTITGGSMTSYTITGLEEDSRYIVNMTAYNSLGNEKSEPVTAMTMIAAPSAPPSPVNAMVESSTSITVQWGEVPCIDQNGAITGYSVQYGVEGSGNTETMTVSGASTTQTTITGLNPSTTYSIQVAAVNSAGTGVYSDPEMAETLPSVYLSLNGEIFRNHSYVDISDIGSTDNTALQCITNRLPPAGSPNSGGDWFAPDKTRVDGTAVPGFTRTRGPMVVRLKRNTATDPAAEGIYHCEVMDNTETEQRVYVGIYNGG